ncbi:hypothetical protein M3Y96_00735400 [Aphelenchoides besseyi]|nr:hypothetical protein M3Y96_00735400 [Aphelenchoides besseyi]
MLQFNFVRIWKFICCSSNISEQNELEIERQKAKAKDTQEFHKYNKEYLSCCGLVHVRGLTKGIIFAKTFFFASLLLSSLSMNISPLVHFGKLLLGLWIGIDKLRDSTSGLTITSQSVSASVLFSVVHLFVDFLNSANTRDTISSERVSSFIMQIGMIVFEVYALLLVWRVYTYHFDLLMAAEIEEKREQKNRLYDEDYL